VNLPASLIAGDTWQWTDEFADHPAPAWVVTYYFEMLGSTFNVVAAASGSAHQATIAAATTAGYKPGRYGWFARAISAGVAKTIAQGELVVEIDPAAAGTADRRSWARKTLDAVEAALLAFATTNIQSYTINGRAVARGDLEALKKWRNDLRAEISTTDPKGSGRTIKLRLTRV